MQFPYQEIKPFRKNFHLNDSFLSGYDITITILYASSQRSMPKYHTTECSSTRIKDVHRITVREHAHGLISQHEMNFNNLTVLALIPSREVLVKYSKVQ